MKNLDEFGVLEMNSDEAQHVEGGIIFCLVFGVSALCLLGPALVFNPSPAY